VDKNLFKLLIQFQFQTFLPYQYPNILGRYRKYELLAKNLIRSNIRRAVEIAKRYGIIKL